MIINQLVNVIVGDSDYITVIDDITDNGYVVRLGDTVCEVLASQVSPIVL